MCTNHCLECLNPGSYCRQCIYPMSLDTLTHRCLSCCKTNLTTNDCCQCSSSWDGFCLHPLVTPSTHVTQWWKFSIHELDSSRQMILIIVLIVLLLSIIICLITLVLRKILRSRLRSRQEHNNIEYVMLQNVDDIDEEETKSISRNGRTPTETTISMNHVAKT